MIPKDLARLDGPEFSEPKWQKSKTLMDKATKTGLGAELIALKAVYGKAKPQIAKLTIDCLAKKSDEELVKQGKIDAQAALNSAEVKTLIAKLDTVSKKADAVSKMKISKAGAKAAADISTGLDAVKKALDHETFTDFDAQLNHIESLYAGQRSDFKAAAKRLIDVLAVVEKAPVLDSLRGTEFSGAYRGFQNKGKLPEFRDLFDDRFDGMFIERMDTKKPEPEIRKEILKLVADTRVYVRKFLDRAKQKGY